MKLVRYGPEGSEQPGLIAPDGSIRALGEHVDDVGGETLAATTIAKLESLDPLRLPAVASEVRLGPPVARVSKIIGVGLNYSDHAAEAGLPVPSEPMLFMKATSAICGPHDDIVIPRGSSKTDWELELAVVIGRRGRYIPRAEAMQHVAGYMICNDVSERDLQFQRQGQFVKGKSADTFAPLGPWLVTASDLPDPHDLRMWLDVNGERRQSGHTSRMLFGVAELISYISEFMTLHPGDVISTGTPAGVGMGCKPARFLGPGDTVHFGIDLLGEQHHRCIEWKSE